MAMSAYRSWIRRGLLVANLCAPVAIFATSFGIPWVLFAGGLAHALLIFAMVNPQCAWLGPVVTHFTPRGQEVWLTIDDGLAGRESVELARKMEGRGARATFFVRGDT